MTATIDEPRIVEFPALKEARGKLSAKRDELAGIFKEAGPDYDMSKVKSLAGGTTEKVEAIGSINAEIDDLAKNVRELTVVAKAAGAAIRDEGSAESGADEADGGSRRARSFAEMLVKSDAFTGFKPGASQGPTATLNVGLKALLSTTGWVPETTRTGRVEMYPLRGTPDVSDFFPQTPTSQSSVVYMEETLFTNTATETNEGEQYPEAALQLTERSQKVQKIAVYLPVTDELFEDVERAQAYVENRLPEMLRQRLDSQLLSGNGVAPNLLGTENVSGIQTQALGSDPVPDAIYKCMRKIRDDGYAEPSVVFIRAAKWEAVRLLKTADGVYIWGSPSQAGPMTIWGVPVKETNAAPTTKAVMGYYANYSELAVRRGIDVQISNSHADFFINGKLAIRADVRVAALHYRAKAFGVVTGL